MKQLLAGRETAEHDSEACQMSHESMTQISKVMNSTGCSLVTVVQTM